MGVLDVLKASGPSLLWAMDHASGAPVDQSGNGRNPSVFGTVTPQYANVIPGQRGARTSYGANPASNGYGLAAGSDISWAAGTDLSFVCWAVLNATPSSATMVLGRRKNGAGGGASMLYLATDRSITGYLMRQGVEENYAGWQTSSGVNFIWAVGAMHMLAATYDSSNLMKFYLDGAQIGFDWWSASATHVGYVTSATATQRNNFGDYFMVGGGGYDTFGTADMTYGPVATFNRVLSASEMAVLYRESLRGGVVL